MERRVMKALDVGFKRELASLIRSSENKKFWVADRVMKELPSVLAPIYDLPSSVPRLRLHLITFSSTICSIIFFTN